MTHTPEQSTIIKTCLDPNVKLVTVEAVSGAGKTATLIEIAKALKPKSGLYLAYNKAIATEASSKFNGTAIECSTIHSLAYRATVEPYGLKVGIFKARDIDKKVEWEYRLLIASAIEDFCLSSSLSLAEHIETVPEYAEMPEEIKQIALQYLDMMTSGKIQSNHSFYLKFYHVLLALGEIQPPKVDVLMLDEFGDITGLTLEIFKLIEAKLKIAVGDSMQTIYRFNKTINGFKALEGQGTKLHLSQSFRVSAPIAERIQEFCHIHDHPAIDFQGMNYATIPKFTSAAYIFRTNGALIGEMVRLKQMSIPYNLTRSVKTLFSLILTMMNLKKDMIVHDPQYKFIEKDVAKFFAKQDLQQHYRTPIRYIADRHAEDVAIQSVIRLLSIHSFSVLYDVYNDAKAHEASSETHYLTLTTAHSAKGLEYDSVTIMQDLNEAFSRTYEEYRENPDDPIAAEYYEDETKLYYVATSRAKYELNHADCLPE